MPTDGKVMVVGHEMRHLVASEAFCARKGPQTSSLYNMHAYNTLVLPPKAETAIYNEYACTVFSSFRG